MRTVGNVKDAKVLVEQWRLDYNRYRPYSSLGDMSPATFAAMCLGSGSATLHQSQDKDEERKQSNQYLRVNYVDGFPFCRLFAKWCPDLPPRLPTQDGAAGKQGKSIMNIVVLDGYTLNPGDLTWKDLESLGKCAVYDRTPPKEVVPRAKDAEIVLTNKTVLSSDAIKQLPKLKYIGVLATGYNIVDIEAARNLCIPVTNVPAYGTRSVAQMVFAHLLNLAQHVGHHAETVRSGRWTCASQSSISNPDFCYWDTPLIELAGLTMGIIGFGRIGQATAKLALAFGMKVIAYDIVTPLIIPGGPPEGYQFVELDEIFRVSDVISLHCPLTPQTKNIINKERLELMKKTAYLVNTSRGPLVDERALAEALNNEGIAGAGLDVLSLEPPEKNNPLLKAKNCFITPHIAWATRAARERLLQVVVDNVASFLAGKPQNVINEVKAIG